MADLDTATPMLDYAALRAYTGTETGVRITKPGIAGFFQRYDSDTSTPDDSGVTIVDTANRRWKRIFDSLVNLLWFSAVADGNGNGGGTDNTAAFARAYAYLNSVGGGGLRVPMSGTGIYRVHTEIVPAANTNTIVDEGVTLDFTSKTVGGVNGQTIVIAGSYSASEIALGAPADRGDLQISTTAAHGLSAGDWFLLKSQRNALHADAGENWRLGTPTGGPDAHACYFGEPCQVASVVSSTVVKIAKGLIFPNYLTNNSQETSPLARASSTIQKIDFKENVKWSGGIFINNSTTIFKLNLAANCVISNVKGMMGSKTGAFIVNQNGLCNKFFKVAAEHSPVYYIDEDHSRYNSFKELSSWWSEWDYEDRYGSQGLDSTYILNGTCNIGMVATGAGYDAQEQTLTLHGGTYGFVLNNIRSFRAKQCGITVRSRFGVINNPYVVGPNINVLGGIQFTGWGIDCSVNGGYVEGYQLGITIGPEQGATINFPQPTRFNISINGTTIRRCRTGIQCTTHYYTPVPTSDPSGILINNVRLVEIDTYGIRAEQYSNYVQMKNIYLQDLAPAAQGISLAVNTVGHTLENIVGDNIPSDALLIRTYGILDRTTFPTEQFPNNRIKIRNVENIGSDFLYSTLNGDWRNIQTGDYTFTGRDVGSPIFLDSASSATFTIPFSAQVFPLGMELQVFNLGAGILTIAGAPGVILGAPNGATLPQYGKATLTKVAAATWILSK